MGHVGFKFTSRSPRPRELGCYASKNMVVDWINLVARTSFNLVLPAIGTFLEQDVFFAIDVAPLR